MFLCVVTNHYYDVIMYHTSEFNEKTKKTNTNFFLVTSFSLVLKVDPYLYP